MDGASPHRVRIGRYQNLDPTDVLTVSSPPARLGIPRSASLPCTAATEIGIGLTSFGCLFTLLGVMLFFDRGLLSMGNILFLSGVTTTIGPRRTYKFFKRNGKGTAAFMSGVALVFVGWPFFGMLVEGYGFLVLFSSFFPTVLLFLKRLPVVGTFLSLPGVKNVVTSLVGKTQTLPV